MPKKAQMKAWAKKLHSLTKKHQALLEEVSAAYPEGDEMVDMVSEAVAASENAFGHVEWALEMSFDGKTFKPMPRQLPA